MYPKRVYLTVWAILFTLTCVGQNNRPYTASFVGRMGVDTVLVETYTMINNHLYGKAFIRVPEDYIGEFSIHFYPDGSIREFNINAMNPLNSSLPFEAKSGAFEYRLNMNCRNDTCTYYNSEAGRDSEKQFRHPARKMDFVGGWVPLISLMEWQCRRLAKSGGQALPLKMINHNIGVYDIRVRYQTKDKILFGGPFLEYTTISVNQEGRIQSVDGMGTPWNYNVTKHVPIDVDAVARRMTQTPGIGIPSPTESLQASIQQSTITLTYGRPYKRGRVIFGGVVPYDSLWRTGANGPTTITVENDIHIEKRVLPKGTYSIYTIPKVAEWVLIFSTDLTHWPTDPDRTKELVAVRIPVRKSTDIKQQFTLELKETPKGGQLRLMWDDVVATADFAIVR
ncbi:DUF2911 domain-containing protein [Fibrisoma montanum]|uniref:DUF2911 domain-containing protein n=1 Tax=Fibrisoma montanum TaxID=2305895 RepID=A0A418M2T4_9BACT|nr:DUF2911 domain-containing protein [Fibrisoma montanum]RIV19998.1 DUF2911 domain-containing protein [Fibrisoma montanum]